MQKLSNTLRLNSRFLKIISFKKYTKINYNKNETETEK